MSLLLNKTVLSNQITGLRPKVKQAKVHAAHHYTREIKKCENRKGQIDKKKFENKASRMRQEALILKEIKPDEVTKFALTLDFNERDKFLNAVDVPLRTKVIVRLATHNSVRTHIEAFRKDFPQWTTKLEDLLQNLGIRSKLKKKMQKKIEKYQSKMKKKQEMPTFSEQTDIIEETESITDQGEAQESISNKAKTTRNKSVKPIANPRSEKKKSSQIDKNHEGKIDQSGNNQHPKPKESTLLKEVFSKSSVEAQICRFTEHLNDNDSHTSMDNNSNALANQTEKVDDPFFVTENNDFLKTASVLRKNGEGISLESKGFGDNLRPKLTGNRAQRRAQLLGRKPIKSKFAKETENNNAFTKKKNFNDRSSKNSSWKEMKINDSQTKYDVINKAQDGGLKNLNFPNIEEKLHPSWEAKRKQAVSLTAFQGKKIKFGDEDE